MPRVRSCFDLQPAEAHPDRSFPRVTLGITSSVISATYLSLATSVVRLMACLLPFEGRHGFAIQEIYAGETDCVGSGKPALRT